MKKRDNIGELLESAQKAIIESGIKPDKKIDGTKGMGKKLSDKANNPLRVGMLNLNEKVTKRVAVIAIAGLLAVSSITGAYIGNNDYINDESSMLSQIDNKVRDIAGLQRSSSYETPVNIQSEYKSQVETESVKTEIEMPDYKMIEDNKPINTSLIAKKMVADYQSGKSPEEIKEIYEINGMDESQQEAVGMKIKKIITGKVLNGELDYSDVSSAYKQFKNK